jgi:hypothetical protein
MQNLTGQGDLDFMLDPRAIDSVFGEQEQDLLMLLDGWSWPRKM